MGTRLRMLGSKVDKLFEILIKTLNTVEYIEFNVQSIDAP